MAALCFEAGADGYVCVHTTTTRNLVWVVARAVQRHQLVRENHRLTLAEETRLQREHDEAACVLEQQRALLEASAPPAMTGEAIRRRCPSCLPNSSPITANCCEPT